MWKMHVCIHLSLKSALALSLSLLLGYALLLDVVWRLGYKQLLSGVRC